MADQEASKLDSKNDPNLVEVKSGWRVWLRRLCASRFNDESLRSKSVALSEMDLAGSDLKSNIRGRWNNRLEFLLSCIGFAVGLGNIWRFPIRVYESGGGAFLIPYLFLCLLLAMPMIMMELGLGQFSGRGPTSAFKCVPLLFAVGWGMVMISSSIMIYYGVVMAWSIFYMLGSFNPKLPWSRCDNSFNTPQCLESIAVKATHGNGSLKLVLSTEEYWNYYVTGFVKQSTRMPMQMSEDPGSPQWHLALCLLLVWIMAGLSLMLGVKVSGKIIYFTALFPYLVITLLIILGCTLNGSGAGIKYYLMPDFKVMVKPKVLLGAVEQLFFSTSVSMGGMLTFASYNDFHDNIYRDSIIIVFADFFTSFLAGFAVFPIIGNMAYRSGQPISKVVSGGPGLFFVTYPDAMAVLPGANFWTFMFMLMAVSLGADSLFAMFETACTALADTFPFLRRTTLHKAITVLTMSMIFFLLGLLITTPGGTYWFAVLDVRVSGYGLPFIGMSECIVIGCVYGIKRFRQDMRMMLGFSPSWYWFVTMGFVAPVIIAVILIASFVKISPIIVAKKKIPLWGEVVAILILMITVLPIFIGAIVIAIKYRRRYRDLSWREYFHKLISPPAYWGPFYKTNWLKSHFYQNKLLQVKDDPKFLQHIPDVENLNEIIKATKS